MKSFLISLLIGAIIVFGTYFSTERIEKTSEKLLDENRTIIECLKEDNYIRAIRLTKNMKNHVDKAKLSLAIIMDHGELDKIESGIAELESYIRCQMKSDALAKCNVLDVLIRHMPKNYKLKIENIL